MNPEDAKTNTPNQKTEELSPEALAGIAGGTTNTSSVPADVTTNNSKTSDKAAAAADSYLRS